MAASKFFKLGKKIKSKSIEGAGDMSQPGGKGKFREGQKQRRDGSSTTAGDAMSASESGKLARGKSARASHAFYKQAVKDKLAGKKLTAAQKDSLKNYPKEMRPASPPRKISKAKAEAAAKLKSFSNKAEGGSIKMAAVPDWMKGLSESEINDILGKPNTQPDGVKRHTGRKKKKTTAKVKGGGSVRGTGKALRGFGKATYSKKEI